MHFELYRTEFLLINRLFVLCVANWFIASPNDLPKWSDEAMVKRWIECNSVKIFASEKNGMILGERWWKISHADGKGLYISDESDLFTDLHTRNDWNDAKNDYGHWITCWYWIAWEKVPHNMRKQKYIKETSDRICCLKHGSWCILNSFLTF